MGLFRRRKKTRLHELGEAEAYHHAYGAPSVEVRTVKLPPRRKRYALRVSGEDLRRRFQERLEAREDAEEGKERP
ncbi:MAG: hypothetical protein H0V40_04920 [Actinobacteria bacterium]|nr:hypothetical protein [Actinomycetota bacterium]